MLFKFIYSKRLSTIYNHVKEAIEVSNQFAVYHADIKDALPAYDYFCFREARTLQSCFPHLNAGTFGRFYVKQEHEHGP